MIAAAGPIAAAQKISPSLLRAVCEVESNYRPRPGDGGKSIGLCQVKPATAMMVVDSATIVGDSKAEKLLALREKLHDWEYNLTIAARLLRRYIDRYGSDELALVAYNGGENHALLKYTVKVKAARIFFETNSVPASILVTRYDNQQSEAGSPKPFVAVALE